MAAGFTCLKVTFIVFNVIFWMLGCGVFGVGLWLQLEYGGYARLLQDHSAFTASALLIAAGSLMIVMGFVGCCGAFMESRCMLVLYFFAIVIVFLLEIVACIVAFENRKEISGAVKKRLLDNIRFEYDGDGTTNPGKYGKMWDVFQYDFECCGVNGFMDWYDITAWPNETWVPDSCCEENIKKCGKTTNTQDWFIEGCYDSIRRSLAEHLTVVSFVALVIGIVQLFMIGSSIALLCAIHNHKVKSMAV